MVSNWWIGFIALLQVYSAELQCILSSNEFGSTGNLNVTVKCDPNDRNATANFFDSFDFSKYFQVIIQYPYADELDFTHLSNIKIIDLSNNNLTSINLLSLNVRNLNISYNFLTNLNGNFPQLIQLDASHNYLNDTVQNLSALKLKHIQFSHNLINNMCNFSVINLEYLNLSSNAISKLCLKSMPSLKILDVSNNQISNVSSLSNFTPKLEVLIVSNNEIEELKDNHLNLLNLLKLDLKSNKIKTLHVKCFNGLSKLQYLDVSKNEIVTIMPSTLQYLTGLTQLIISENEELSLQDFGLLLASRRLKSVNASKTGQNKIPSSLIRSVRYLFLSYNNIKQIESGDMDSYPLLNSLDLSYNNISFIEDDALGRLEFLTTINLNNNSLTSIPYTLPNNLKILLLRNNLITKITKTDFFGLGQLKELDLSNNKIIAMNEASFVQLYNLEKLNLSRNDIQVVQSNIFMAQKKLTVLDLSFMSNVTKCDQVLCFPVPENNQIQDLYLEMSPVLSLRLLNDAAALKTFKQLQNLNMVFSNLSEIRNDMASYFPRLHSLYLNGNHLNCSKINLLFSFQDIAEPIECNFIFTDIEVTTKIIQDTTYYDFDNQTDLSNEIWYKETSLGEVDAYSAEIPKSHPGLFILLLIPIGLVATGLILHYSRLRRKIKKQIKLNIEREMEIPNISSELW